jgi:hypothetical protein
MAPDCAPAPASTSRPALTSISALPQLAGPSALACDLRQAAARAARARRVCVEGPRGAGQGEVARALAGPRRVELCGTEPELVARLVALLAQDRPLLLRRVERIPAAAQRTLAAALSRAGVAPPIVATLEGTPGGEPPDLDLLYLLGATTLALPPLAERAEDLPALVRALFAAAAADQGRPEAQLSDAAVAHLSGRSYPGELEELDLCLRLALLRSDGPRLGPADCSAALQPAAEPAAPLPLGELERHHVERVLGETRGNRARAARLLGIHRSTLYSKLAAWGAADRTAAGA